MVSSRSSPGVANHRRWVIGKHPWYRRQVAEVHAPKERSDGRLVCGDRVEIAHRRRSPKSGPDDQTRRHVQGIRVSIARPYGDDLALDRIYRERLMS
jgi:hypothetical protein